MASERPEVQHTGGNTKSSLIPLTSGPSAALSPRTSRALGRQLGGIQAGTAVDVARIDSAVQRREAVAEGITAVTGKALQAVALVSQAEQNLAQTVPHA